MLEIYMYGNPALSANALSVNQIPMTAEDIVSGVSCPLSDVEKSLMYQIGIKESSFTGMDRTGRAVCVKHFEGTCQFGEKCPLRHIIGHKIVVCKHWLRGLCKKGDLCEFLHEYDLTKMPECFFYSKYMACSNRECPFRHTDPEAKINDCPWYDRGFCKHGPYCKLRHRKRVMCLSYLSGFCPDGPHCKFTHVPFNLDAIENPITNNSKTCGLQIICHNCHEKGHKAMHCPNLLSKPEESNKPQGELYLAKMTEKKSISEITCYKCGEKGHYANRCHKGFLAFLSNTVHLADEQRRTDEQLGKLPTRSRRFNGF